jgi:subtilisin-like proprotein convertase family protein
MTDRRLFAVALVACLVSVPFPALAGGADPAGLADPQSGDPAGSPAPNTEGLVIVKFADEARVRLRASGLVSLGGATLSGVEAVLTSFGNPSPVRLFTRPEAAIDRDLDAAERRSGRELADLNGYFELVVNPGEVDAFISSLERLDVVQTAYPAPRPAPPPGDIPPATPDFEPDQGYLDPAPGGIDAREAWTRPGGRGTGVFIIDIEYDWRDTHEDLDNALGQELCWTPKGSYTEHGTAVLGELGSGDNGYGVTGIVNDATLGMVTQDPVGMSNSVARAIDCATSLQGPGDVMLLETQTWGPGGNYVPSEWNQAEFDAISAATAKGIVVVEAAGNGNQDLDDPIHQGKFDRNQRDSGAIIVGAGASPNAGQPDRSKLSFSTYGSRVDVQGWGHNVTTSGYGGLFNGGGDPNQYYTATFNGTSSASPIVTGAAAAIQGVQIARGSAPLDPTEVRRILTDTGSPQQDGPYPGHIGPRPDLARALEELNDLLVTGVEVDDTVPLGNADGVLDPGETAVLRLTVKNAGSQTATQVTGTIADSDPNTAITDHLAGWPDLDPDGSAVSLPPHHTVTVQPAASCGDTIHLTVQLSSTPFDDQDSIDIDVGQRAADYPSADTPFQIPKKSSSGITSTIDVPDTFTIDDVQVSVDISHGDIGEIRVVVQSPAGTTVTLHDHTRGGTANLQTTYDRLTTPDGPGSMNDFDGETSQGIWSLQVVDDQGGPVPKGSLNGWSVELTANAPIRCNPLSCGEPVPGSMDDSLRLDRSGPADILFQWDALPGAAEYRVWRSDSPDMAGETLVGQTAATNLLETGGLSGPEVLIHYQLRAVNSCEWEGP